jgi:hypothetical protein
MSNIFSCHPAANTRAFTTQTSRVRRIIVCQLEACEGHRPRIYNRKQATVSTVLIACHAIEVLELMKEILKW